MALSFPNTFDPVMWEQAQLDQWEHEDTFALSVEKNKQEGNGNRQPQYFVFQEGPPTANGQPGLHHVLARTFKDLVCRWKTMQGYVVERKAGWDCHGLPVEREVEKMLGLSTYEQVERFGLERFNQLCAESVWKYQSEWEKLSQRMGYWTDMKNRYATMDVEYMESEWWALKQLWKKGLLKRGYKVMPYSPQTGTTYSSRDVAEGYQVVTDLSCFVRFPLVSCPSQWENEHVCMMVWTSTPWTLPGNAVLAVHKDFTYVLVKVVPKTNLTGEGVVKSNQNVESSTSFRSGTSYFQAGEVFCVAQDLLPKLKEKLLSTSSEAYSLDVMRTLAGSELLGLRYSPPFGESNHSHHDRLLWHVVHADFVNNKTGTGVVHVAPMYGEDDHLLCTTLKLDLNRPGCQHVVGPDGRYLEKSGRVPEELHQLDVTSGQTQEKVLELLHQHGLLYRAEPWTHEYPHCWRNKSHRLLYYAMEAWFVTMADPAVRSRMQHLNSTQVQFSPENVRDGRFGSWLEQSRDWCVSRRRTWGCPLPVWVCRCGHEYCVGSREELRSLLVHDSSAKEGMPLLDDLHTTHVNALRLRCDSCHKDGSMCREPYVLDCWFDSGCAPFAQWHYPFAFSSKEEAKDDTSDRFCGGNSTSSHYNGSAENVVDFVAEGQDQCRGWFYSMHALSTVLFDRAAFQKCLVVGLLLDENGAKMSKSLGNGVDPWKHFNDEGADALRWYLLGMSAPWMERRFEAQKVRLANQKFFCVLYNVSKWWHAEWSKAAVSNSDLQCSDSVDWPLGVLDRWVLSRLAHLVKCCNESFEKDQFHVLVNAMETFVAEDLSKTYLRLSRAHFSQDPRATVVVGDSSLSLETAMSLPVARRNSLTTMRTVLLHVCRLVAPMAPFFVDVLHRSLMKSLNGDDLPHNSVHLASWTVFSDVSKWVDSEVEQQVCWLRALLDAGRVLHEKGGRPGRLPLTQAFVAVSSQVEFQYTTKQSPANDATVFPEELALVLAYDLNVRQVTVLGQDSFETLLANVQEPTLRPNFGQLGSRYKENTKYVLEALDRKFGSCLRGKVCGVPPAVAPLGPETNKSRSNNDDDDWSSLAKKSKKQMKREQKARASKARKQAMANNQGSATTSAAWKGPKVEEALKLLQANNGVLEVASSNKTPFDLQLSDFHVTSVPCDGFAVSSELESSNPTGLVLDLCVTPELVSMYLAKELTHLVHHKRKQLEQKRFQDGRGPLGLVTLHVVLVEKDNPTGTTTESATTNKLVVALSKKDWDRLLEATWAHPKASLLDQQLPTTNQEKLHQCQQAVRLGLMDSLEVRSYGTCGGFQIFVQCRAVDDGTHNEGSSFSS